MSGERDLIPGDQYQGVIQEFVPGIVPVNGAAGVRLRARVQSLPRAQSGHPAHDLATTLVMDMNQSAALDLLAKLSALVKKMDWLRPL